VDRPLHATYDGASDGLDPADGGHGWPARDCHPCVPPCHQVTSAAAGQAPRAHDAGGGASREPAAEGRRQRMAPLRQGVSAGRSDPDELAGLPEVRLQPA